MKTCRPWILGAAGLLVLVASQGALAQAGVDDAAQAGAAFERAEYALALTLFERASEAGHARAAQRAGEMRLLGQAAFGAGVERDLQRALQHLARANQAGLPTSGHLLERIGFMLVAPDQVASEGIGPHGC